VAEWTTEVAPAGENRTCHLPGIIKKGQFTQAETHFYAEISIIRFLYLLPQYIVKSNKLIHYILLLFQYTTNREFYKWKKENFNDFIKTRHNI
jgi:hypothetical protein